MKINFQSRTHIPNGMNIIYLGYWLTHEKNFKPLRIGNLIIKNDKIIVKIAKLINLL